jgi:ASC-1-like (ASCH) protein
MKYTFDTNDRPFQAIKAGTKKVEGRTPIKTDKTPYNIIKAGDLLIVMNNLSKETMKVEVDFIHHYPNAREMLEKEGPENCLSSEPKTVEHGIESYNSLEYYKEGIKQNGIYAIGVKPI